MVLLLTSSVHRTRLSFTLERNGGIYRAWPGMLCGLPTAGGQLACCSEHVQRGERMQD